MRILSVAPGEILQSLVIVVIGIIDGNLVWFVPTGEIGRCVSDILKSRLCDPEAEISEIRLGNSIVVKKLLNIVGFQSRGEQRSLR
ncbi:hypothetical protein HG531_004770 [Fusarium graminearum]|nr:hypothetical protein HG531_004770 [Fusarium graminearum]